jgi:hypothetical protein
MRIVESVRCFRSSGEKTRQTRKTTILVILDCVVFFIFPYERAFCVKKVYTVSMDLERIMHVKYRTSIVVATVLSVMVVIAVALLGRGTLNLRGALVLDEPTDVTVIAAVEPKLQDATIAGIQFLRKEPATNPESPKPAYAYLVGLSTGESYLTRVEWDLDQDAWVLITFEKLHAEAQAAAQ